MRLPSFSAVIQRFEATFQRFPLAMLSAIMMTVAMFILARMETDRSLWSGPLLKLVFAASLGFLLFTVVRLLRPSLALYLAGIVIVAGYYLLLPDMRHPPIYIIERHFFLLLLLLTLLFWAPFGLKPTDNTRLWSWVEHLIGALRAALFFSGVLFLGILIAVGTIKTLFGMQIDPKFFGETAALIFGFFATTWFLSLLPEEPKALPVRTPSRAETIFVKYLLTPLTALYFVILYLYTAKILFSWSFPKGMLAWLIILFSAVAIVTYLFWTPFVQNREHPFRKAIFAAILFQTPMLFFALYLRVSEYGWTANRYLIAILGVWLAGVSLYALLTKNPRYQWLFLSLSLVIFISQIGPASAYAVDLKSQRARLAKLLHAHPKLSDSDDIKLRFEIGDIISHLSRYYGIASLRPIMKETIKAYEKERYAPKYSFPAYATRSLGFKFVNRWELRESENQTKYRFLMRQFPPLLDIAGYNKMVTLDYRKSDPKINRPVKLPQTETKLQLRPTALTIKKGGKTVATVPLQSYFSAILTQTTSSGMIPAEKIKDLVWENEAVRIKLIPIRLEADADNSVTHIHALLLYASRGAQSPSTSSK